MNGRDVFMAASLLITGLVIGYLMGRNTVVLPANTNSAATAAPAVVPATPVSDRKDSVANVAPSPPTATPPEAVAKAPTAPPKVAPTPQPQKQLYPFSLSGVPLMGEPAKAKVAIILFSDFQ